MSDKPVYIAKSALDSFSNALYAERLELGSREPMLTVNVNINQKNAQWSTVDVKVMHFIRGEERNKTFDAQTKPAIVQAALKQLQEYARIPYESDEKPITTWEIMGKKIAGGKMTNEIITKAKLVVGRNKKGVFISVVHWNTQFPHIAFHPGLNDGQNVRSTASDDPKKLYDYVNSCAVGWAEHISGLITTEWSYYINKSLEALRSGNASGGGNSGGNSYGNNNRSGGGNSYGGSNSNSGSDYAGAVKTESSGDDFSF